MTIGSDIPPGGVGPVATQVVTLALPEDGLVLAHGGVLPAVQVAYETYGALAPARDNVVFVCHALTGDAHAAGVRPDDPRAIGWWDEMIGPGKGIDTRYYHVVCANILGGCKGTTGPRSINPATGKAYGSAFPRLAVSDIVDVHRLLLGQLGIERIAAVVGGSFGGMQALDWVIRYPEMVERCICIASSPSLSAQALAFDAIGREVITADPDWLGGDYYERGPGPVRGLAQARKIGHITYLSQGMMETKFGRGRRGDGPDLAGLPLPNDFRTDFQVEGYLAYQSEKFIQRFDANSYLHITSAMDEFDLAEQYGSLDRAFGRVRAKMLAVALSTDWLFPVRQTRDIAAALLRTRRDVSYCVLEAAHGHDAFLVDVKYLSELIRAFLPWIAALGAPDGESPRLRKPPRRTAAAPDRQARADADEQAAILRMVDPGTRIVDLGCGNADILDLLATRRGVSGVGVDTAIEQVINVIDRGYDVVQEDIDGGLAMIPDGAYDYALLGETLQVLQHPRRVLREMLRVAREGIVTFPNFGKISHRSRLWLHGRMPVGGALPFSWYDTPNIHLCTLRDFVALCREEDIRILDIACVTSDWLGRLLVRLHRCNLGADRVLARIARSGEDVIGKTCLG
jgi:homoserine O-acetyltransferase/O-succinyltransferase